MLEERVLGWPHIISLYPRSSALIRRWVSPVVFVSIRGLSRRRLGEGGISFSDTELAEDAAEEILGIMSPDDITDGIERASKLNRNELG